jgi:hypothetical protein
LGFVHRLVPVRRRGDRPGMQTTPGAGNTLLLVVSWLWVGIPLVWGVVETLRTSLALFR